MHSFSLLQINCSTLTWKGCLDSLGWWLRNLVSSRILACMFQTIAHNFHALFFLLFCLYVFVYLHACMLMHSSPQNKNPVIIYAFISKSSWEKSHDSWTNHSFQLIVWSGSRFNLHDSLMNWTDPVFQFCNMNDRRMSK